MTDDDDERAHALLDELVQRTERVHELQSALSAQLSGVAAPPRGNARHELNLLSADLLGSAPSAAAASAPPDSSPASSRDIPRSIPRSASAASFPDDDSGHSSEPGSAGGTYSPLRHFLPSPADAPGASSPHTPPASAAEAQRQREQRMSLDERLRRMQSLEEEGGGGGGAL